MAPKKGKDVDKAPVEVEAVQIRGSSNDVAPGFFELSAFLSTDPEDENRFDLHVTLRVNAAEIAHEDRLIEVRAREATLVLDMDGLEEDLQQSRFGDFQLEIEHRKKVRRDVTTEGKLAGKAAAKGTLTPVGPLGSLSAEASAQGQRSFKTVEKDKEDVVLRRVLARPNGRWTFLEPDGSALDGTYLLRTKLCSLRRKEGANRIAVVGRLLVKQRDLTFHDDDPSWRDRLSRSKQRLFDLFLTHVLSGDVSHRAPGMFILSRVEIEP